MNWESKVTIISLIVVLCIVEAAIFIDGPDVTDDAEENLMIWLMNENVMVWMSQDGQFIYVFHADNTGVWTVEDWRGVKLKER